MVASLKDKYRPDTIVVKLRGLRKEGLADGVIYPGQLVDRSATGYKLRPLSARKAATGSTAAMIVVENELFGKGITEAYAPEGNDLYKKEFLNDLVQVEYLLTGAEVRVSCMTNRERPEENIAVGDLLSPPTQRPQAGEGSVSKYEPGTDNRNNNNPPIGIALEARNSAAANNKRTLILMEIL